MKQPSQQSLQEQTKNKYPIKTNWKLIVITTIVVSLIIPVLLYITLLAEKGVLIPKPRITPPILQQVGINEDEKKPQEQNFQDWQTYRNEEFGFEMKYPPVWGEPQGSGETFTGYFQGTSEYPYSMIINVIRGEKSFDGYLDKLYKMRGTVRKGNEFTIENRRAFFSDISDIHGLQIETFIDATPKMIVQILLLGGEKSMIESLRQLDNQILSTFRFVE